MRNLDNSSGEYSNVLYRYNFSKDVISSARTNAFPKCTNFTRCMYNSILYPSDFAKCNSLNLSCRSDIISHDPESFTLRYRSNGISSSVD